MPTMLYLSAFLKMASPLSLSAALALPAAERDRAVSGAKAFIADAARRIGLVAFAPAAGDSFEPGQHQTADGRKDIPDDAKIFETIATGYTFQGQMLRPALVMLDAPKAPLPAAGAEAAES